MNGARSSTPEARRARAREVARPWRRASHIRPRRERHSARRPRRARHDAAAELGEPPGGRAMSRRRRQTSVLRVVRTVLASAPARSPKPRTNPRHSPRAGGARRRDLRQVVRIGEGEAGLHAWWRSSRASGLSARARSRTSPAAGSRARRVDRRHVHRPVSHSGRSPVGPAAPPRPATRPPAANTGCAEGLIGVQREVGANRARSREV